MPKDENLALLNSQEVSQLAISVEEAARAANQTKPRFVEPARGTLDRAKSRRHHIIFGRRGSGKTSLLSKAAADLTVDRRPIAFINLESFKGHSYPDVLLSVLIQSFEEFKNWFETAATNPASKTTFWARLFGTKPQKPPLNKKAVSVIVEELKREILELNEQLHLADAASLTRTTEHSREKGNKVDAGLRVATPAVSLESGISTEDTASSLSIITEESRRSKLDFLLRHIIDYQKLFRKIAEISAGEAFLFLDDLYYIRRNDQPLVVDYFHRIAKASSLWLKIGTIRHRTDYYRHQDPPVGLKLGDDADEIDLDQTLEKYGLTKRFLMNVLSGIAKEINFNKINEILAPTAIDRLVLASGGVARDFLGIFRRAIDVARERNGGPRGPRVAAQDVNQAAGEYYASKQVELNRDTVEERHQIETAFEKVRSFCLSTVNSNCFLIVKDRKDQGTKLIEELVDLRLLHLVQSRVTISDRPGDLYIAYMLDLGQYAGERTRRGLEMIPFWQPEGKTRLRRVRLIYEPWKP